MRLPGAMTLMTLRWIIDATRARVEGIIQLPVISVMGGVSAAFNPRRIWPRLAVSAALGGAINRRPRW
jgi:hypothetical protein